MNIIVYADSKTINIGNLNLLVKYLETRELSNPNETIQIQMNFPKTDIYNLGKYFEVDLVGFPSKLKAQVIQINNRWKQICTLLRQQSLI